MSENNISTANAETIISITGMHKWFGDFHVLKDIDLEVKQGERIVICGPSGSGKSTLIKILTGALKKDAGEIWVRGNLEEINDPSDAFRIGIAAVYQDLALIENRNVVMNMFLGMELNTFHLIKIL